MIERLKRIFGWYNNRTPVDPHTASAWERDQETMRTIYRSSFPVGTDEAHIRAAALGHLFVCTLPPALYAIAVTTIQNDKPHAPAA